MTHLHDIVDPADLERGFADGFITERFADDGQRILNYSPAAMYTPGAWDNPAVRACRGLILAPDGEVVARPWSKFFNYGQDGAAQIGLHDIVEITDKLDGSLGIIHPGQDGRLRVASRGSFTSSQALHATQVLRDRYPDLDVSPRFTLLVEIVYPENRIVCDYGNLDDLILLGAVHINTGTAYGPGYAAHLANWSGPVAETFGTDTLYNALQTPPRPGAEGICLRAINRLDQAIVKVKQEDYIALHRAVTGISEKRIWEHWINGGDIADILDPLPDEIADWALAVWRDLESTTDRLAGTVERATELAKRTATNRKEFAALATSRYRGIAAYMFQHYDGKDYRPAIRRSLKPTGDTRPYAQSEDTK